MDNRRELIATKSKLKKIYKTKIKEWKENRWKRIENSKNIVC